MRFFVATLILLIQTGLVHAADIGIPCVVSASDTPIIVGDIFECSIESVGDSDVYTFSGNAGDIVILTLSDTGNGFASLVAEVYMDGLLLTTLNANNTGVREELVLASSNTYTVIVFENGNNATDTYSLALQSRAPLPPEAFNLCVDCVTEETISPVADSDVSSFTGTAGDTVILTLSDTGNGFASMIADVFDPNQAFVTSLSANNTGIEQQLTLGETGGYTILLRENGDNNTDTYNLALQQLFPTAPAALPLPFNMTTGNQTIDPVADSDVYTFMGAEGDTVRLTLTDVGNGFASMLADVFGPDEQLITTLIANNTGVSEDLSFDVGDSGIYTIRLRENGNNNTDTYTLGLQCIVGSCFADPDVSVSPTRFNFGNVDLGSSSAPQTFTVTNSTVDDADLEIFTVGSAQAVFAISNDNCTGAILIPGASCTFDGIFTPDTTTRVISMLTVASNDPDMPALEIPVAGTGIDTGLAGVTGVTLRGVDGLNVKCSNLTTMQTVTVPSGGPNWDCGAVGFDTSLGDQIQITIQGLANP